MKTKLTLSVNHHLLARAKKISAERKTTLSEIFEKTILLMENDQAVRFNPKVKALQGILNTGRKKATKNEYFQQAGK
jgi:Family of unknown function (DUF6364)